MSTPSIEPTWLTYARSLIGTREIPGPKHNPTIMNWIAKLGAKILGVTVKDDETPWCSTFAAHVIQAAGFACPIIAVRASSWDQWGAPAGKRYLGAIVRFQRPGGGHAGFLTGVSPDGKRLRVLGGNQSNMVCETWIEADRLVATRWPAVAPKATILAPVMTAMGKVSTDEA